MSRGWPPVYGVLAVVAFAAIISALVGWCAGLWGHSSASESERPDVWIVRWWSRNSSCIVEVRVRSPVFLSDHYLLVSDDGVLLLNYTMKIHDDNGYSYIYTAKEPRPSWLPNATIRQVENIAGDP